MIHCNISTQIQKNLRVGKYIMILVKESVAMRKKRTPAAEHDCFCYQTWLFVLKNSDSDPL